MVTHHVEEILDDADQIVLMKEGEIFRAGGSDEVLCDAHLSAVLGCDVRVSQSGGRYVLEVVSGGDDFLSRGVKR